MTTPREENSHDDHHYISSGKNNSSKLPLGSDVQQHCMQLLAKLRPRFKSEDERKKRLNSPRCVGSHDSVMGGAYLCGMKERMQTGIVRAAGGSLRRTPNVYGNALAL